MSPFTINHDRANSHPRAIIIELERQGLLHMTTVVERTIRRDTCGKLAWDGCSVMSVAFLQSQRDIIRFTGDSMFQVAMMTHPVQLGPIIAPLVGRYFGKNTVLISVVQP